MKAHNIKWLLCCCWASATETVLLWFLFYRLFRGYYWFTFWPSEDFIFIASPNRILAFVFVWCFWMLSGGCRCTPNVIKHQRQIPKQYLWSVMHPKARNCVWMFSARKQTEIRFFPSSCAWWACASPSCCDLVLWGKHEIMNWLICRGRFRGGQRRGNGSELSIWDYPDLMGEIKRPMGGNPLSIRADFVTLTRDVILQDPFRGSAGERAQYATRWQYIQFHTTIPKQGSWHWEENKSCYNGQ